MVKWLMIFYILKTFLLFCFLFSFTYGVRSVANVFDNESNIIKDNNSYNNINNSNNKNIANKFNYGKMLYENPRGIKCIKCHGIYGQEKIISRYKHKGIDKKLIAPAINNISFKKFRKKLYFRSKTIMPSYFFTDDEIRHIYNYLSKVSR
jgi:hypothetical protein